MQIMLMADGGWNAITETPRELTEAELEIVGGAGLPNVRSLVLRSAGPVARFSAQLSASAMRRGRNGPDLAAVAAQAASESMHFIQPLTDKLVAKERRQ